MTGLSRTGCVENTLVPGARVAFVLESPHVDEVAHGYPLAGDAGRTMSRYLFERYDVPFGLIALHHRELISALGLPCQNPYSVMNVSRTPLQKKAYCDNKLKCPSNIDVRRRLKKALESSGKFSTGQKDVRLKTLKTQLFRDFELQAQSLGQDVKLVPCGNFARAFCEELDRKHPQRFILRLRDVPHPSRAGWKRIDPTTLSAIRSLLGCRAVR
jgi:hypothetical protein